MPSRRVLVIEQDLATAEAVVGLIRRAGDLAEVAADATHIADGGDLPDVVLVRAELGGRPTAGLEVCSDLKAAAATAALPVVIYASEPAAASLVEHRGSPTAANTYLPWPFTADELLDHLHLLTDGVAAAPAAADAPPAAAPVHEEEVTDWGLDGLFDGEAARPTPPEERVMDRATYDPLMVGLSPDRGSTPAIPVTPPPPAGPAPLGEVDLELQGLIEGIDAQVLDTTAQILAVDDADLDALAEELGLPPAPPAPPSERAAPAAVADLDDAVAAEFADLVPPPPPAAATAAASAVPAPPAPLAAVIVAPGTPTHPPSGDAPARAADEDRRAREHADKLERALEAAAQAAASARDDAEAARAQAEDLAGVLTETRTVTSELQGQVAELQGQAADLRGQAAGLAARLAEAEAARDAASVALGEARNARADAEQALSAAQASWSGAEEALSTTRAALSAAQADVAVCGEDVEQARQAQARSEAELRQALEALAGARAELRRVEEAAAADRQAIADALHRESDAAADLRSQAAQDAAIRERVTKAVRIALALLEGRA